MDPDHGQDSNSPPNITLNKSSQQKRSSHQIEIEDDKKNKDPVFDDKETSDENEDINTTFKLLRIGDGSGLKVSKNIIETKKYQYSLKYRNVLIPLHEDNSTFIKSNISLPKAGSGQNDNQATPIITKDSPNNNANESDMDYNNQDNFFMDNINKEIQLNILKNSSLNSPNKNQVPGSLQSVYSISPEKESKTNLKYRNILDFNNEIEPSCDDPYVFFKENKNKNKNLTDSVSPIKKKAKFFDYTKPIIFDGPYDFDDEKKMEIEYSKDQPKKAYKKSPTKNSSIDENENKNFCQLNMETNSISKSLKKIDMKRYKFQLYKMNKLASKDDSFENEYNLETSKEGKEPDCQLQSICMVETFNLGSQEIYFKDINDGNLDKLVNDSLFEFGFEQFRPNQDLVVKRILCGKSTLFISPTASGKSLCYQLAAYCFWKMNHYITIVVSPLISLMEDQIKNFPKCLKGVCFNSSQHEDKNAHAINMILRKKAQILFLSPECLVNGLRMINFSCFPTVAFVCIDEAHCLGEWSWNFRPSYLHLYKCLKFKLNITTTLSLTATVTSDMAKILCKNLELGSEDIIGKTDIPDNLILTSSKTFNKMNSLAELIRGRPYCDLKSIIIYCTRRDTTQIIASFLRATFQFESYYKDTEYFADCYHAGLPAEQRKTVQSIFIAGKLRIVVATIAFGMGINKKDVRAIIHYDMPKSFENYVQEIGRAGRDGQTSYCHLFLDANGEELFEIQKFIYADSVDKENLKKFIKIVYEPCKCKTIAEGIGEDPNSVQCPSHPVALPIKETEIDTDIKSEVLYSLLLTLENVPNYPIRMNTSINSNCRIIHSGDEKEMMKLINENQVIKAADIMMKQMSKFHKYSNFNFSIVDLSRLIGKDIFELQQHLKQLEMNSQEFKLKVLFTDYSYLIHSSGLLDDEKMDNIVEYLYNVMKVNEENRMKKLFIAYSIFNYFTSTMFENNIQNLKFIKGCMDNYFKMDKTDDFTEWQESFMTWPNYYLNNRYNLSQITNTINKFINTYKYQRVNTPRKIARILQGISSPAYPARKWSNFKQFWRSLPNIDFMELMKICHDCLDIAHLINE